MHMDFSKVTGNLTALGYKVREFGTAEEAARWLDTEIDGCTVGLGGSETLHEMGSTECFPPITQYIPTMSSRTG